MYASPYQYACFPLLSLRFLSLSTHTHRDTHTVIANIFDLMKLPYCICSRPLRAWKNFHKSFPGAFDLISENYLKVSGV